MKAFSAVLALAVSLLLVASLSADEGKKCPGKHGKQPQGMHDGGKHGDGMGRGGEMMEKMLKDLNLTDEQKSKIEALRKEYGPKFKETYEKMGDVVTADQKKAREKAVEEAKKAGKKREDIRKSVEDAMKLTDEQKSKMAENRKAMKALHDELHAKITDVLTPEQKEKLKQKKAEFEKKMAERKEGDKKHEHHKGQKPETK